MLDQIGIDGQTVGACVQQIVDSRTQPAEAKEDILRQLERDGLVEWVTSCVRPSAAGRQVRECKPAAADWACQPAAAGQNC